MAVTDSLVFIGTGESLSVDVYNRDGQTLRRLRYAGFPPVAASAEDHETWVEETLATLEAGMAEHMRPFFENTESRTPLPP
jgi:hypothetical protein